MTQNDEQVKLQMWMEDYALYQLLQSEKLSKSEACTPPGFSQEPSPAERQIRLWPAKNMEWPPLYGVILSAGYTRWRVFPFSELAHPGVPQELKVCEEPPLRVLQGWNTREMSTRVAAQSWFVGVLPEEKWFEVNRWWLALSAGSPLAGPNTGPELRHPRDPRHDYMEQEVCRIDACLGEERAEYGVKEKLKKAAEPESEYGEPPPSPETS